MKDNAEGRNEQNVLYQLLESAKKMERKKKRKSTDLRIRASTDSNPSPIPSETSPETKVGKLNTILQLKRQFINCNCLLMPSIF